ncbi:MAG: zinc-ribbon domain-containing protein [Candidatus Heimdallarchaeota archaeon]|nr:zinc-ribbon domain-containing protein [Candidatus Heimdallarchaeota archaeon]
MKCPQCENDNPDQAKFCFNCGFNFSGKELTQVQNEDKYAKYIPQQLLAKLEESAKLGGVQRERRIIIMPFCDLEGSTAASAKLDPEE